MRRIEVSHRFAVDIDTVWALVSDVERMAGVGPEHVEAHWVDAGPAVGAQFTGRNRRGDTEWEVPCYITECVPPHVLTWTVLEPEQPSSIWSYSLSRDGDDTLVVQRFEHGPNYSFTRLWAEHEPDRAEEIVRERMETLRANMRATLANAERLLRQGATS